MSAALKVSPDSRQIIAGGARAELMLRNFYEFVRGGAYEQIDGTQLEENPHILALCLHLQAMFFGWLVAEGKVTERTARGRKIIAEVDAHWARHGLDRHRGELLVQNLLINIAPGTLKSRIVMVLFPAWVWLHAPGFKWACTSSNDENVKRDSDDHAAVIGSPWYRETFGVGWTIRSDKRAVNKWSTTAGGQRISRTILSSWVGIHVDGILADDPDDPHRVFNEPERLRTQSKWTKALENRVVSELRSFRIIVQQRVHVNDLSAYVLAQAQWSKKLRNGWAWLCMPLEWGKQPANAPAETPFGWRDWRTQEGEVLHPERFPQRVIDDKKLKHGTHGFESQYNQNPEPIDGGMFSRGSFSWFRPYDMPDNGRQRPDGCAKPKDSPTLELGPPKIGTGCCGYDLDDMVVTIDSTFGSTEDTASAVGLLIVGIKGIRCFIFEDGTETRTFLQTLDKLREIIVRWRPRRLLIENKANGDSVMSTLKREIADGKITDAEGNKLTVVIEPFNPGKDSKVARAHAMQPHIDAGLVFLLEGAIWIDKFLAEVCVFPKSPRDDRVDALAQLIARLLKKQTTNPLLASRW